MNFGVRIRRASVIVGNGYSINKSIAGVPTVTLLNKKQCAGWALLYADTSKMIKDVKQNIARKKDNILQKLYNDAEWNVDEGNINNY